jgi:hypothetical protein
MSHDGKSIWVSLTERNLLAPLGDSVHRHLEACGRHGCCLANHSSIVHDVVRYKHRNLRVCWAGTGAEFTIELLQRVYLRLPIPACCRGGMAPTSISRTFFVAASNHLHNCACDIGWVRRIAECAKWPFRSLQNDSPPLWKITADDWGANTNRLEKFVWGAYVFIQCLVLIRHESDIGTSNPSIKDLRGDSLQHVNAACYLWASGEDTQLLFHLPITEKHDMDVSQSRIKYGANDLPQPANCRKHAVVEGDWCLSADSNCVA